MPISKAKALGLAQLEESGLTEKDAKELKIEFLEAVKVPRLHPSYKRLCSLKRNYLDCKGKPLKDWPKAPPFYRIRYLEEEQGFNQLAVGRAPRYVQEPNTAPVAYYPANQYWDDIVDDPDQPVIITEGEFKAAKACKEGFPTIGLGGVYNWRANKLGITWLESLNAIKWLRRNVYICFDSDYRTNPMVCAALKHLADELVRHGSFVYLLNLPQLPGLDKVGLDDFLVNAGPTAVSQFEDLLAHAEPLGLTAPLFMFNEKYAYIRDPGLLINTRSKFKVSAAAFKDHLESGSQYQECVLRNDGSVSYKPVAAAPVWLKWPLRREVLKLTYAPGDDDFVTDTKNNLLFNIWPGWGVEPKKGKPKLFLDLIDHLFKGAEPGAKEWFLCWCAYPLQNPGAKMFSSAVLHGIKHGTGKSLVGYTLGKIYGKNFTEINQMDLHNGFNEWAEAKQLVMGDDVTGSNKRAEADFLKKIITQREIRINPKYIPSYVVPDCINYFFTANGPDSFFLEDDDRRFFIHEVEVGPLTDEFYTKYDKWLHEDDCGAEVFHYLLNMDLKNFNPSAAAFKTSARARMINNLQSDLASWVRLLQDNPDQILKVGKLKIKKDLFQSKELLQLYDPDGHTGTTANGLARELSRAGFKQVYNGRPIKTDDDQQGRYIAVRNCEHWAKQTGRTNIVKHLNAFIEGLTKRKKY